LKKVSFHLILFIILKQIDGRSAKYMKKRVVNVEAHFQYGSAYGTFEGHRDGSTKISTGTWKAYKSTGKLAGTQGEGTFTITAGARLNEFIMEMEGEYEAA
jgi:hypothetical protein